MSNTFVLKDVVYDGTPRFVLDTVRPDHCPHCGYPLVYQSNSFKRDLKSISPDGEPEEISIDGHRYVCANPECKKGITIPVGGLSRNYSDDFIRYINRQTARGGVSNVEFGEKYGVLPETIRVLQKNYNDMRNKNRDYRMPQYLGIEFAEIREIPYAVLTDVRDLSVLDVIPVRKLSELDTGRVREILISDPDQSSSVREALPGKPVILLNQDIFSELRDALKKDLFEIPFKTEQEREQALLNYENGDAEALSRQILNNPELVPVAVALSQLKNKDLKKLESTGRSLEHLRRQLGEIAGPENGAGSELDRELLEEYRQRIHNFLQEIKVNTRRKPNERQLIFDSLFIGNDAKSVPFEEGIDVAEPAISFRIPLKKEKED